MQYVFGAISITIPLLFFGYERHIIFNGIEIDATIIRIEKVRAGQGRRCYHSVLSYHVDGKEYETMEPTGVALPTQAVGEVISIIYYKENPNKIVAKSMSRIFAHAILIFSFVIGVIVITNGVFNHLL